MIGFGICLPILPEHMQEILALNDGILPAYMRGTGTYVVAMHIYIMCRTAEWIDST